MEYTMLKDLNDTHDSWRIRKNGELISVNMIFIDEKENLIHATIKKHLVSRFRHLLREGSAYSIKNPKVVQATGDYGRLSKSVQISRHGFQFVMPADTESRSNDTTILTDVVGLASGIGEVDIVGNNWKKRDLHIITNHSVNATITLFAQHSRKLKFIESSNSNKYTLEEKMFFHRMNIKELEYVATVRGKIFEIKNQFGWYYVACKSCGKNFEAEDGDYKFKVHVHIKDHTGTTTLTLFSNVVERLLDISAKKLVNRLASGDSDHPKELNTLIGKEFIYRLRLNHYNFKQGYANYTVSEIYEPRKCLEHEYESKKALEVCSLESSMVDDAEESGANKVEGGVSGNQLKAAVEVRKRRKMVVLDDDDDNDNGDAN
ncbi:hypothetical protein DCAR_0518952 [Daucus carota subsp. sativus]|uniref:Replication factor A C-terminal domain-containing protein n=1 Tax=Daucus carota subsp. sativus TaxID=79200 RepID=A0AAF1AYN8_DAUCS|nr:hypothetical protein DCAR_0518952 [Daucus carota subsp. sativus]